MCIKYGKHQQGDKNLLDKNKKFIDNNKESKK